MKSSVHGRIRSCWKSVFRSLLNCLFKWALAYFRAMTRAFLAMLFLCLGLTSVFAAEPPDELFVRAYQLIQRADLLLDKDQDTAAMRQYLDALDGLKGLQKEHPSWNAKVVQFRLDYVNRKLAPLRRKYPQETTTTAKTPMPKPVETEASQVKALKEELIRLRAENAKKESALESAKKGQASAAAVKKAEERSKMLESENKELVTTTNSLREQMSSMVDAALVESLRRELADVNKQLETTPDAALLAEREKLIKSLETENKSLQKKVDGLTDKGRLAGLREENGDLKKQVVDLNKRLKASSGLEEKNESLEASVAELKVEVKDLESLISEERRKNNQLTRQLKGSEQGRMIADLNKENTKLTGEIKKLEGENAELKTELKTASGRVGELEKMSSESAQAKRIAGLEKENSGLQSKLTKMEEETVPKLEADNAGLKASVAKLRRDLKAAEKALDSATGDLKTDVATRNRTIARQARALAKLEEEADRLSAENKSLIQVAKRDQRAMAEMVEPSQISDLQAELRAARKALESKEPVQDPKLIAQLSESRAELKEQRTEMAALKKERSDLEKKLKAATEDRASARELRSLTKKLEDSTEKQASLQKEIAKLESEQEELEDTNRNLAKQIDTMKSDTAVSDLQKDLEKSREALLEARAMEGTLNDENDALIAALSETKRKLKDASSNNPFEKEMKSLAKAREESEKDLAKLEKKMAGLSEDNDELEARLKAAEQAYKAQREVDAKKLKALEDEKDDLEKQLRDATKKLSARDSEKKKKEVSGMADELAGLKAKLEAVNAKKVPYSKEEMALFEKPAPKANAPETKKALKNTELPDSVQPLIVEAQRAYASRSYETAETKYKQALSQSENNVFTLANLAAAQIEQEKLPEAEKNLERALRIDADHGHSLFQYGYLKYRQGKKEEALDYLSRAAKAEPENGNIQNYLGIVLSEMGQRGAAEAALRKAIQLSPGNASAHHNLAVIYATQKPPLSELAYWHYQKARDAGHVRNESLEKLIKGR